MRVNKSQPHCSTIPSNLMTFLAICSPSQTPHDPKRAMRRREWSTTLWLSRRLMQMHRITSESHCGVVLLYCFSSTTSLTYPVYFLIVIPWLELSVCRFIEYGEYKENLYGTSIEAIRSVQAKNKMCLVDVQPEVNYCRFCIGCWFKNYCKHYHL